MNIQETIEHMIRDVIRVRCSKVLLSPEMYHGCLDLIVDRCKNIGSIPPFEQVVDVFVRGVRAEKCHSLSGTEYALVPLVPNPPDDPITINGVPVEFIPPFRPEPAVPDEQRRFHHFDTQKLIQALFIRPTHSVFVDYDNEQVQVAIEYVAGQMLAPEVRKRVLEARVFEPE